MTFVAWRIGRNFGKWHVERLATDQDSVMQCGVRSPKGQMVSRQQRIPVGDVCEKCMLRELAKCLGEREAA